MKKLELVVLLMLGLSGGQVFPVQGGGFGDAQISGNGITIRTSARFAGAIDSLIWNGREFIDRADHGRQLQSASNMYVKGQRHGETFNPTEAGSRMDGNKLTTSSKLLHLIVREKVLQTTSQMAFWLNPGEESGGHPARNTTVLSDHLLTKRVAIGWRDLSQVLHYDVTFGLPVGESHSEAQFEILTGYMPAEFSTFLTYNPASQAFDPLTDGPGEQRLPVVLATEDNQFAMGIYSPDPGVTYGRFRFEREQVVKWNAVHRIRNRAGVPPGEYSYGVFVPLGTLRDVKAAMEQLHERFSSSAE